MATSLTSKHSQDLKDWKNRSLSKLQLLGIILILLAVGSLGAYLYMIQDLSLPSEPQNYYVKLFLFKSREFQNWMQSYAFKFESSIFSYLTQKIGQSISYLGEGQIGSFQSGIHLGLMQLAFFLIVSWKFVILAGLLGFFYAKRFIQPYTKFNFMGLTGNGRVYYSGIRVGLDSFDREGRLLNHVPALACAPRADRNEVVKTELYELCSKYELLNNLNFDLISIIVAHKNYPAFVDNEDENIVGFVTKCLNSVFHVRDSFAEGEVSNTGNDDNFESLFVRAIIPEIRKEFLKVDKFELASLILSVAAGRVLYLEDKHGAWYSKSQYPHLSARAILMSCPDFARDYQDESRSRLRQALCFAQRNSDFGRICLPENFDVGTQCLRTLAELMFIPESLISGRIVELEYYIVTWFYSAKIKESLRSALMSSDGRLIDELKISESEVGFIPFKNLLPLVKSAIPKVVRAKLAELNQELARSQAGLSSEVEGQSDKLKGYVPTKEKLQELMKLHQVPERDLMDWIDFKVLLFIGGLLVKRVGLMVVPEETVVSIVWKNPDATFSGRHGDVPIRITQLISAEMLNTIPKVKQLNIAKNEHRYLQLLKGASDQDDLNRVSQEFQ